MSSLSVADGFISKSAINLQFRATIILDTAKNLQWTVRILEEGTPMGADGGEFVHLEQRTF